MPQKGVRLWEHVLEYNVEAVYGCVLQQQHKDILTTGWTDTTLKHHMAIKKR